MAYITKSDLLISIREAELDEITEDDTLISQVIDIAEDECKSLVGHRFNFDNNSPKMKQVMSAIAIYHLYALIAPNKIPQHRRTMYNGDGGDITGSAIGYLKELRKGEQTTPLSVKTRDDGTNIGNLIETTTEDEFSKEKAW